MLDQRIRKILSEDLNSRSDDRRLLLKVWESYGFQLTDEQKWKFMSLPSSESVRRTRQKIQEKGLYPANEYVKKQRKFKSMRIRQVIPGTEPDKVDSLIQEPMFNLPKRMEPL